MVRYYGPGNLDDNAQDITVDDDGNVYVTGDSYASGTSEDFATIKYNSEGIPLWVARYDGPINAYDYPVSLAVDSDGNVYVTGKSFTNPGDYDFATIKYDENGIEQWTTMYDGPQNEYDYPTSLAVDLDGNVFVSGYGQAGPTQGDNDYITIKYNSMGYEQWVEFYNGPEILGDEARMMVIDSSGNVYVTGASHHGIATVKYNTYGSEQWITRFDTTGDCTANAEAIGLDRDGNVIITGDLYEPSTGRDYITIKYNADGVEQWIAYYDGSSNSWDYDYAISIAVASDGDIYVSGYSMNELEDYDFATVKYSRDGIELWEARYNGIGGSDDFIVDMVIDEEENVYITGYSWGGWLTMTDYVTIKYDSSGQEQWIIYFDGPVNGTDEAKALSIDGNENIYVTGSSFGSGTDFDYATIKYSQTTVVSVGSSNEMTVEEFGLYQSYPNPFNPSTTLSFDLPSACRVELRVYDVTGRQVAALLDGWRESGAHSVTFDASHLPSGIYIARLEAGDYQASQKLVLLK